MPDLIDFLENNAFRPTRDEVEAILRRCDHDADGALNYEEFCACIEDSGNKELDKRRDYYDKELDSFYDSLKANEEKKRLQWEADRKVEE